MRAEKKSRYDVRTCPFAMQWLILFCHGEDLLRFRTVRYGLIVIVIVDVDPVALYAGAHILNGVNDIVDHQLCADRMDV